MKPTTGHTKHVGGINIPRYVAAMGAPGAQAHASAWILARSTTHSLTHSLAWSIQQTTLRDAEQPPVAYNTPRVPVAKPPPPQPPQPPHATHAPSLSSCGMGPLLYLPEAWHQARHLEQVRFLCATRVACSAVPHLVSSRSERNTINNHSGGSSGSGGGGGSSSGNKVSCAPQQWPTTLTCCPTMCPR